ncbi:Exopolyphosphatase [Parahypoxylon ruwenzoriense]
MPPQKTLQAFLATARAALTAPPAKRPVPLHFVVGNEAADLDSLCSTLFLAYFRSHAHGALPHGTLHIPLCHLPREDLALRPEFDAVLARGGVTTSDVLTLSELPGQLRAEDTRWLLVDHNAMTGALGRVYGGSVVGCIDHHEDEGVVPRDAEVRVVEKSGSCMSLVVEQCAEAWDGMMSRENCGPEEEEEKHINAQLAYLALAPILIDTTNLGNRDKTTAHDERAVAVAEAKLALDPQAAYDRAQFFAHVSALKEDISRLPFRDVLRKDYKEWDEEAAVVPRSYGSAKVSGEGRKPKLKLGTSSIPQSFAFLVRKAGGEGQFVEELDAWCAEKDVDVVAVLTTCKNGGEFRRELLVWGRTGPEAVGAAKKFAEAYGERLGLGAWDGGRLDAEDGDGSWRRCWTQARLENSRKQIAPMLREVLKG